MLVSGKRLVPVRGDGHGCCGLAKRVADGVLVAATADEDPDCGAVEVAAHLAVDDGHVEAELAGEGGLELARFQLDDDVAELLGVKEEEVDEEVVAINVKVDLAVDEREAGAELAEGVDNAVQ